jgi:transglutaminase-like putative cysteine protease
MNLIKALSTLILLIVSVNVFADKPYMKYGKITEEEINMTACTFDSNASAVVLGDIGTIQFKITETDIRLEFNRHLRIKIFNKESFNKGNFSISLYKSTSSSDEEKLTAIKGAVYNIINGELEKSKLNNSNIFNDEVDKNHDLVKVTFPDIQEGSIIEIDYTVSSPFIFTLEPWYFQDDIPTLYSEYTVANIEWYYYKNWVEGYHIIKKEEEARQEKFSFYQSAKFDPGFGGGRTSGQTVEFSAKVNYMKYTGQNIPAFKDEPYITAKHDYLSSVHFELESTKYPWTIYKNYTTTWSAINVMLNEDEDFGVTLKYDGHLSDIKDKIEAATNNPLDRTIMAYDHIKNHIAWDGRYRIRVDQSIRKAYNDQSGNSADINLNLVALCRKLGLEAYPVIISTRKHGKVRPGQPKLTQFNHTIAAVKINEEYMLLDAIDPNCPYNLLPTNSLNDKGRLINDKEGEWVDLYTDMSKKEIYFLNLSFNSDFELIGDLSYRGSDYAALEFRDRYDDEESEEGFIVELKKSLNNAELLNLMFDNIDSIDKPVGLKSEIKITDGINVVGDMIFFNPKIIHRKIENVFKSEERTYPIDYNFPLKEQYIINITLPEGYVVDEIPERLIISIPNNKMKYTFALSSAGNALKLTNQFEINQTIFPGTDYPEVKKFYELMVTKEAEQVVLKKIN